MMIQLSAPSLEATHQIASALAGLARRGDVIVLGGEMGSGKTAFAQGFGAALGIEEPITSPTYTLVHSYRTADRGVPQLHHADLYRLERTSEVSDLALNELAEYDGIVLIEWGDVVESMFGDHLLVLLSRVERDENGDDVRDPADDPADDPGGDPSDDPADHPADDPADSARIIAIEPVGPRWAARWSSLLDAVGEHRC